MIQITWPNFTSSSRPCETANYTVDLIVANGFVLDHTLFIASHVINLALGLPANIYVVWLIASGGLLATEYFTLNLAVCEIIYPAANVIAAIYLYIQRTAVFQTIFVFFSGLIIAGRPLFQCCVCVERYLAVIHPVFFVRYRPLRYRLVCSVLIWVIICSSCLMCMLLFFSKVFFVYHFVCYMLFLGANLFCCLAVLRVLKRPAPGERDTEKEGTNSTKIRAFRLMLMILLLMLTNYITVLVVIPLLMVFDDSNVFYCTSICFAYMLISGFAQPLVYLHRAGKLHCITGLYTKLYKIKFSNV